MQLTCPTSLNGKYYNSHTNGLDAGFLNRTLKYLFFFFYTHFLPFLPSLSSNNVSGFSSLFFALLSQRKARLLKFCQAALNYQEIYWDIKKKKQWGLNYPNKWMLGQGLFKGPAEIWWKPGREPRRKIFLSLLLDMLEFTWEGIGPIWSLRISCREGAGGVWRTSLV